MLTFKWKREIIINSPTKNKIKYTITYTHVSISCIETICYLPVYLLRLYWISALAHKNRPYNTVSSYMGIERCTRWRGFVVVYGRGLRGLKDLDLYIDDSGGGGRSKALEEDWMQWQNIILYWPTSLSHQFRRVCVCVCVCACVWMCKCGEG